MPTPVKIIGSYLSPYVRKVLAALHLKGIPYEIDPIVAFMGDDRFSALSPVRRIPVLIDDRVTLCDSSVICQYLEDRYPQPAIYPADVVDRARARWLEEYADTRMGDVFIWQLFNQVAIGPYVWGRKTDEAALARTLAEEMPQVLGYLESQLPAEGFFFGRLSIADLSVAVFFRNATFARYTVDATKFPRTAAFVERVLAQDCLARLKPFEEKMLRTPIPKHRQALIDLGAPILAETYGTATPRPGLLRT
jgi:glutathione S-transferase